MKELISNPKRLAAWNFWLWTLFGILMVFVLLPACGGELRRTQIIFFGVLCFIGVILSLMIMLSAAIRNVFVRRVFKLAVLMAFVGGIGYLYTHRLLANLQGMLIGSVAFVGGTPTLCTVSAMICLGYVPFLLVFFIGAVVVSGEVKKEVSPKA